MAIFSSQSPLALPLGILGNVVSIAVFLAPVPTFYRIWRKKSTEAFHSLPYIAALFSASLWIYYASLKSAPDFLLITVNSLGCLIESVYLLIYIVYAPKQVRMCTLRLLLLLNIGGLCSIVLLSHFVLPKGSTRIQVLGGICVGVSVCVFAAPLSTMRTVVRTKSVEFVPMSLSFALTMNAVIWLLYGILLKDLFIALPNSVGIILGVVQMVLYMIFRKWNPPRVTTETGTQEATMKVPVPSPQLQLAPLPKPDDDDQPRPKLANLNDHYDNKSNIGSTDANPVIIAIEISPADKAPLQGGQHVVVIDN